MPENSTSNHMNESHESKPSTPAPVSNALLAWLFAPFTSFMYKNDPDSLVREHARQSFYLGIANLAIIGLLFVLWVCSTITLRYLFSYVLSAGWLLDCFWGLVWLANAAFIIVPRLIGIIKANQGQTWEVPYVTQFLSKYIRF